MPKILPARFVRDHFHSCKACHSTTRKLCRLCQKCDQHCKCEEMPDTFDRRLRVAFEELYTSIHKLAIESAAGGPITEGDVYEALTKTNFEAIMSRKFKPPKED